MIRLCRRKPVNGRAWSIWSGSIIRSAPRTASMRSGLTESKSATLATGFRTAGGRAGFSPRTRAAAPFEGFRWRSDSSLNLNWIWLQNYSPDDPPGFKQDMKFDHVVVVKSYIGCLSLGCPDTAPPAVPTGLIVM